MPPVSTTPEPEKGSPCQPYFGLIWQRQRCAPHNGSEARGVCKPSLSRARDNRHIRKKQNAKEKPMPSRPTGVIPPMTTPFGKDGEIDLKLVAPQMDWMI